MLVTCCAMRMDKKKANKMKQEFGEGEKTAREQELSEYKSKMTKVMKDIEENIKQKDRRVEGEDDSIK